jgi:hypothetical protein
LRAQAKSKNLLSAAWDLEADPDQRTNLLEGKYLGPAIATSSPPRNLRNELLSCIKAYAKIDNELGGTFGWFDSSEECTRLADWR